MRQKKVNDTKSGVSSQLRVGKKWTLILIYLFLTGCALLVVIPLYWMVTSSLKDFSELLADPWGFPKSICFENFVAVWTKAKLYKYLLNTVYVTVLSVILSTAVCAPLAFVLARYRFKGNRILYYLVIAGMMVPIHSAIIPIYMTAKNLNMTNNLTYLAFIYSAFRIPFTVFILESFMRNIPREMEESAFMDGCSVWKMFTRIILPLSKDGIVTVSIMTWISSWNELLVSMLLTNDQAHKTLPNGLMGFIDEFNAEYTQLAAGVVIAIIPSIILFALAQKQIEKGLTAGSVKG